MSNAEAAGVDTAVSSAAGRPAAVAAAHPEEGHPARWWILAVLAAVAFIAQRTVKLPTWPALAQVTRAATRVSKV